MCRSALVGRVLRMRCVLDDFAFNPVRRGNARSCETGPEAEREHVPRGDRVKTEADRAPTQRHHHKGKQEDGRRREGGCPAAQRERYKREGKPPADNEQKEKKIMIL